MADDAETGSGDEEGIETALDRLEAASREVETLATRFAVMTRAFGAEMGARARVGLVKGRLKIALDELETYPGTAEDITDG